MMRTFKTTALLILGVLVMQACKPGYQEQLAEVDTTRITKVRLTKLESTNEPIPVEASGVLASKAQALLSFKIGGIIDNILVEEGQSFRKGQVLAQLELTEINARVNQANQSVQKLLRDKNRVERLYADTVATLEQLQDITTAFEVAQADLEVSQYNLRYASIIAKSEGKVLKRLPESGELINPGSPVFQVAFLGKRASHVVKIGVADRDVVKMQLGDSAQVTFDVYPDQVFSAYVSELAEAADPRTGTFEVELTMPETGIILKNGFVAKLKVYPSLQEGYFKVPMSALVEGDLEQATVFVRSEKTVRKLSVRPIHITDQYFTIADDHELSMEVVTEGSAYAKAGERVEFLNR